MHNIVELSEYTPFVAYDKFVICDKDGDLRLFCRRDLKCITEAHEIVLPELPNNSKWYEYEIITNCFGKFCGIIFRNDVSEENVFACFVKFDTNLLQYEGNNIFTDIWFDKELNEICCERENTRYVLGSSTETLRLFYIVNEEKSLLEVCDADEKIMYSDFFTDFKDLSMYWENENSCTYAVAFKKSDSNNYYFYESDF